MFALDHFVVVFMTYFSIMFIMNMCDVLKIFYIFTDIITQKIEKDIALSFEMSRKNYMTDMTVVPNTIAQTNEKLPA